MIVTSYLLTIFYLFGDVTYFHKNKGPLGWFDIISVEYIKINLIEVVLLNCYQNKLTDLIIKVWPFLNCIMTYFDQHLDHSGSMVCCCCCKLWSVKDNHLQRLTIIINLLIIEVDPININGEKNFDLFI